MQFSKKLPLNGISYTAPTFILPKAASVRDALCIFKKNLPATVQGFMSTLERNPTTLVQTEVILKGQSVAGISLDDLAQVKHYGDGAKLLIQMLEDDNFALTEECVCKIHNLVAKDEALTWGKFRNSDVSIGGVDYMPPVARELSNIATEGFALLQNNITCPIERAVMTFLFMARSQFFHDANKRTASLIMNGILLQNCYYPITVFEKDSEEFHTKLSKFYNSGDATEILIFFSKNMQKLYPNNNPKP